ncbi:uncharacterized protein LOC121880364 [Homarus americanus]|uniref:Putative mucin-17-like 2 n=1 Tax=Homarus americanus TaxID=6706 RepID=A0A8J5JFD6_HOMAM|nr:uncharacterized protein LOC121880364 [Homarus americanus]KAG7157122.1 putative mucin-17-like 2 [Homarus americanus]
MKSVIMEVLMQQMSSSLLAVTKLRKLLDIHLPQNKKTKPLPWVAVVKGLVNRAADTSSEVPLANAFTIIDIKLNNTLQRGLKHPEQDGRCYCILLGSLVCHIYTTSEIKELPMVEVNRITSLLLTAVIDLEAVVVRKGEETEAISRIFTKLTVILGHCPELLLDTLLHCKTLTNASARRPLIFAPLIKCLFATVKSKSVKSPELYLKYLFLGKLWLFMTKKEEVVQRRAYIINSVKLPRNFVDWAEQNEIPWLRLDTCNTRLILKNMTVSSAFRTLYPGDAQQLSSLKTDSQQPKKKKKKDIVYKIHNVRTAQGFSEKLVKVKSKKKNKNKSKKLLNEDSSTQDTSNETLMLKNKKKSKGDINSMVVEDTTQDISEQTVNVKSKKKNKNKIKKQPNEDTIQDVSDETLVLKNRDKINKVLNEKSAQAVSEVMVKVKSNGKDKNKFIKMINEDCEKTVKMKNKKKSKSNINLMAFEETAPDIPEETLMKKKKKDRNVNMITNEETAPDVPEETLMKKKKKDKNIKMITNEETTLDAPKKTVKLKKGKKDRNVNMITNEETAPDVPEESLIKKKKKDKNVNITSEETAPDAPEETAPAAPEKTVKLKKKKKDRNVNMITNEETAPAVPEETVPAALEKTVKLKKKKKDRNINMITNEETAPDVPEETAPAASEKTVKLKKKKKDRNINMITNEETAPDVPEETAPAASEKTVKLKKKKKDRNINMITNEETAPDVPEKIMKLKKKKEKTSNKDKKLTNEKTTPVVCEETQEIEQNKMDVSERVREGITNTKSKHKQIDQYTTRIEQDEEMCALAGKMGKYTSESGTEHTSESGTAKLNETRSIELKSTSDIQGVQEEVVKTKRKKKLHGAAKGKAKKMKIRDNEEKDGRQVKAEEEKEVMMMSIGLKNVKRKNLETDLNQPVKKKRKTHVNTDNTKHENLDVVARKNKGKKLKNIQSEEVIKEKTVEDSQKQNQWSLDRGEVKSYTSPLTNPSTSKNSALSVSLMGRKHTEVEGHARARPRIITMSDSALQRKHTHVAKQQRKRLSCEVGREHMTKQEIASLHQKIRKDGITFTVIDLEPATKTQLNVKCEDSSEDDLSNIKHESFEVQVEQEKGVKNNRSKYRDSLPRKRLFVSPIVASGDPTLCDESIRNGREVASELNTSDNDVLYHQDTDTNKSDVVVDLSTGSKEEVITVKNWEVTQELDTKDTGVMELPDHNEMFEKAGNKMSEVENDSVSNIEEVVVDSDGDSEVERESDKSVEECGWISDHFNSNESEDSLCVAVDLNHTEKILKVPDEACELTYVEMPKKSPVALTGCVEDLDSDIEIIAVEEKGPKPGKKRRSFALKDYASDIDEASGCESDIVPCDEKAKMFTDKEIKDYHNKLMEAEMQRKVEDILKKEEKELKEKMTENENMASTNVTEESSTVNEKKNPDDSKDLVSQMINNLYKPSIMVEKTEIQEQFDEELNDDSDIEVILQTIVKDTGRLTSIHGICERLSSSRMTIKEELRESDNQQTEETEVQENKVVENSPLHCEKSEVTKDEDIVVLGNVKSQNNDVVVLGNVKSQNNDVVVLGNVKSQNNDVVVLGNVKSQNNDIVVLGNVKSQNIIDLETESLNDEISNECNDPEIEVLELGVNVENKICNKDIYILETCVEYTKKLQESVAQDTEEPEDNVTVDSVVETLHVECKQEGGINKDLECTSNIETLKTSYKRTLNHDTDDCGTGTSKLEVGDVFKSLPDVKSCEKYSLEEINKDGKKGINYIKGDKINEESDSVSFHIVNTIDDLNEMDIKDEFIKEETSELSNHVTPLDISYNYNGKPVGDSNGLLDGGKLSPHDMNQLFKTSIPDFPKSESGSPAIAMSSLVVESVTKSEHNEDFHVAKENEEITSSKKQQESLPYLSNTVLSSINSIAQHESDERAMKAEIESITEESEKSLEMADEAYEASSDASEDPTPKTRRRARSLRRNLTVHAILQEFSDSDASPVQRTRRRKSSEVTGNTHLGSTRKRSQSFCQETVNSTSGASVSLQSSQTCLSEFTLYEKENGKAWTDNNKMATTGEVLNHCASDSSENDQTVYVCSNKLNSSNVPISVAVVNRSYTMSSSSVTPSATGTPVKSILNDGVSKSPIKFEVHNISERSVSISSVRRSSRLMGKVLDLQKKQSGGEVVKSDLDTLAIHSDGSIKSVEIGVLMGKSGKETMSDSESEVDHVAQLKTVRKSQANECGIFNYEREYESPQVVKAKLTFNKLSLGLDESPSLDSLPSTTLQNKMERSDRAFQEQGSEKLVNCGDNIVEGDTVSNMCYLASRRAKGEGKKFTEKNIRKISNVSREKSIDNVNLLDINGEKALCGRIVDVKDQTSVNTRRQENISEQLDEGDSQVVDETIEQNQERDVEYLDEGEELEVLSTSGTEENDEVPSHNFPTNLHQSDSELERNNVGEKKDMPALKTLRSRSRHLSRGKGGKKDSGLDVIKREDISPPIPHLNIHCVSEAVLTKEVLISPEVSDEECELVSPGVANDVNVTETFTLPEALLTSPKRSPSPIAKSSHGPRKNSGGIRSPQKMIPEEQDETTLPKCKSEDVSITPHAPKVKSLCVVTLQDKVKSKASCTVGTSDKSTLTKKPPKTPVVESLKSPKTPSRNRMSITNLESLCAESSRKRTSSRSNTPIKKVTPEMIVTKENLVKKSDTPMSEDFEKTDKIDVGVTVHSLQETESSIQKVTPETPLVTVKKQSTSISFPETMPIISRNESSGSSTDSNSRRESVSKVLHRTRSFEKDSESNTASEVRTTNEESAIDSEDEKLFENRVQHPKSKIIIPSLQTLDEQHIILRVPIPENTTSSSSPVSSLGQYSSLRRSSRLRKGTELPSSEIQDLEGAGSVSTVTQNKKSAKIVGNKESARAGMSSSTVSDSSVMEELPSGVWSPVKTRKRLHLGKIKASQRTAEATSSLSSESELSDPSSSEKDESLVNKTCMHDASPTRLSSRPRRSIVGSCSYMRKESPVGLASKGESPAMSLLKNNESPATLSSRENKSRSRSFSSNTESLPRSSSSRQSMKNESPVKSSSGKSEPPPKSTLKKIEMRGSSSAVDHTIKTEPNDKCTAAVVETRSLRRRQVSYLMN